MKIEKDTNGMVPSLSEFSLWKHQLEAIQLIHKYVKSFQEGKTSQAALVNVPTGAGKSGIIALATRLTPNVSNALVLCPRIVLRDQLKQECTTRFFTKLKLAPNLSKIPKAVELWDTPPKVAKIKSLKDTVIVATIQAFHSWSTTNGGLSKDFSKAIDLLIIDEGHCEPAPQWQQVVRSVAKPTILFTATPFRNDLKAFSIDFNFAYCYTHQEAKDACILRQLTVIDRPTPSSPKMFVDDVLSQYESQFGPIAKVNSNSPRIIIRCEASDLIRQICTALKARSVEYIAIHENFTKGLPCEYRHVPDPLTTTGLVWVHQFKMVEGIDDARFRLVAIYKPIKNTRMLIQQVGRVLRNPNQDSKQQAFLLDYDGGLHRRAWERYLLYDEEVRKLGISSLLEPMQQILNGTLCQPPPIAYIDRTFRTPLNASKLDPMTDICLPKSTNVFDYVAPSTLSDMENAINAACKERDLPVQLYQPNANTVVALVVVRRNSPYLENAFFLDTWLGVVVIHLQPPWLFIFDSDGAVPDDLPGRGAPSSPAYLRRMFAGLNQTRLTRVAVSSANMAANAYRTRTFTALSIRDTLPNPDDSGSACMTVEGVIPKKATKDVRRYLGFRNGRVSDYQAQGCQLGDYLSWLSEVSTQLQSTKKNLPEFSRFAKDAPVPPDPTPTHILLDVEELLLQYVTIPQDGATNETSLEIEDQAISIHSTAKDQGTFSVTANGHAFKVHISFDPLRKKYLLNCPAIDGAYRSNDPAHPEGIIRRLNATQAFRVLPETRGYFFAYGQFYHPDVEFGPSYTDDQLGILRSLIPVTELRNMGEEKGDATTPPLNRWPAKSLFGLIQDLGGATELNKYIGTPTHLICDDLLKETADFILGDSANRRIAFIHAKATEEWHPCSASNLGVICGQAMKNVRYLAKFTQTEAPGNAPKWGKVEWKLEKRKVGRVLRQPGSLSGLPLWEEVHKIIRDPHSISEVWLLLGKILSKSEFEKKLKATQPAKEAVQLAYLLYSTMTAAYSVGASLRVFCSP